MAQVFIKRGVKRELSHEVQVQSTQLINELNYELGLLSDIASMQGKATQTKRELLARANAHFIH
jgi:hypothetical protein